MTTTEEVVFMPVRVTGSDKALTLAVAGRFDFGMHDEFRSAYAGSHADHYIVDLADTDYIDSSALGLLVLLREHAGGDASSIEIVNCSSDVRRILKIANFHRLFWVR